MNYRHYKLVFSKIRGMLVAVSEAANSHNDGARGETMGTSSRSQGFGYTVKQSFAALLMALQAFVPTIVNAQAIANDPNQAGSKPIVLAAGNGTPVINIVSPNSHGVSLNQFSQYNIGKAGVVLNNSGGLNQTQLAGYVQGNPMLGNASASTIINQVTGANGSNINGFHEIAGNKANLVIANPNGISVNGAGFINATNVTLTTGTPQLSNGALSGFNVSQGIIAVNGDGLNATNLDKITLISRAAQLNAGIWAKQADVILGANQVAVDNSGHPANITTQQGTGTAPQFALDVSQLGSMYSGQMRIIGTEAGLGINNGGQLISDAGDLTLDAQGQLSNTGKIQSANDAVIKTAGIDNSGHIGAINNLSLTSTQGVVNSGKILAGSVQMDATAANNTGSIIQTGDQALTLNATQLTNSGTIGIAEDTSNPPVVDPTTGQATSSNTETPATDTGNTNNPEVGTAPITTNPVVLKAGHITVNNTLTNSGSITTSGALAVNANEAVSNSGAIRTAAPLVIQTQTLNNTTKGSIKSQNDANITATAVVHNQGSLQAQNLTVTAPTIDNNQGNLTGEQVITLNASGQITNVAGSIAGNALHLNTPQLDNTKGSISTNSDLTLDNARLDNSTGRISAKNLTLNNRTLTNTDGQLIASENLTSTADRIINSNGTIAAGTALTVSADSINNDKGLLQGKTTNIRTASLTNTNNLSTGGIIGQDTLNITSTDDINNQGGLIVGNTSVINAARINNTKGSLQAAKTLTVKTGALNNTEGNISSQDKLTLTADNLINNNGNVATAANLALNVDQLNNTTGTIIANQNALIQSNQLNNDEGGLIQASNLNITAANLSNKDSGTTGGIIATKSLDIAVSGNISNAKGYIGGETATLQAAQLDNQQGQVNSNNGLNVAVGALNNTSGILGSAGAVSLSTESLNNSTGLISSSKSNVNLKTSALINDGGQIIANASTALVAKTISNTAGLIQGRNLSIAAGTLNNTQSGSTGGLIGIDQLSITTTDSLNNQAGYLAGKQVTVHAASMDNSNGGSITATDTLNLTSTGALNNTTGKITANGTTQIAASTVSNDSGTISSLADLTLNTGALSNAQGLIIGNQNTTLSATTVNNTKGLIQGRDLTFTATSLDNSDTAATGGLIAINTLKVNTTGDLNNTSGYIGGTNATINGANINNGTGKIAATDLTLTSSSAINNAAGQISVSGNASISSGSLNNQNGLVYARQNATLNVNQIDNSNTIQDLGSTAANPKGIQAQSLTIKGDALNNSTGQIIGGNVSTTSATTLNNQAGQILGGNLSISAPSLNNVSGKLLADHTLDLTTQNYTHQGQAQGNHLTALHLKGDFVNQGTLSSGGNLSIDTDGSITNSTGSTLSATDTLTLNGQNITNGTDATIVANHTQLNAIDTLTNNGTIDGALTELRAKALINNHKIYGGTFDGNGGVLIGADTLTNNANAVIASRSGMNIGAAQITNQPGGLIQAQGDLSVGRSLGTAAEGYAITGIADRLDNNSATIEVGGNVKQWNVAETLNKNTQFTAGQGTPTTSLTQYYVVNGTEYRQDEALYVSAPAFKLGFSYGYNVSGAIELNNVIKQNDFNRMTGFLDDDINPKGVLPFEFIILPSSKYPFDKFTIPSEYYLKNPQQLELVNGVDYTISSPFTTNASYTVEGFPEISVDGFNTASPKIFNKSVN